MDEYVVEFKYPSDDFLRRAIVQNEFPPSISNIGDLSFWHYGILRHAFARGVWLRYWKAEVDA